MEQETSLIQSTPELVNFILEARRRGFDDWQIREPLLKNGWPESEVQKAFLYIKQEQDKKLKEKKKYDGKVVYKYKNSITIHLDSEVLKIVERRAKKNMLTVPEQIEDIVRRSCVNTKKNFETEDNVDDTFLKLFSRKTSGRPRKK